MKGLPLYAPTPRTCQGQWLQGPSGEQVVSYAASWTQFYFLTLCWRPRCDAGLFAIASQEGARDRFQAWTVVKILMYISLDLLTFLFHVLTSFGGALFLTPVIAVSFAVTVASTHFAWFAVVKKEGFCGRRGYLYCAVWLLCEPVVLSIVALLVTDFIGCLRLLFYLPNAFLAAACVHLYVAPPAPVQSAMDRFSDAVQEALAGAGASAAVTASSAEPCCGCPQAGGQAHAEEIRSFP